MRVISLICLFMSTFATMTFPSFEEFQILYNKTYAIRDINPRKQIYQQNIAFIQQHNSNPNYTYQLGLNYWADLTWEEFKYNYLGLPSETEINRWIEPEIETISNPIQQNNFRNLPSSWDWRTTGTVAPIQSQGQCGSCWAFSAISSVEQKIALKHNQFYKLSEQQLVDCNTQNYGCNGGYMSRAFQYIRQNRITTNHSYPYEAVRRTCRRRGTSPLFSIRGYGLVRSTASMSTVQQLAKEHVLVIGIHANRHFQFYQSGIFNGPCTNSLNHAVNIVGYTPTFWIIRNSWGMNWGEQGYMRLDRTNGWICGIQYMMSYAIV